MTEADITQEEFNAELVNESYESASSSSILHTANDTSLAAMTGPDAEYTDSEPVTALVDPVTSMQPDDSQASSSREDNKENFNFSAKPPHSAGDMETYTELSSPIQSTNLEPPGRSPPHPSVQSPRSATPRSDGEESPGGSVRRSESGRGRTSRVDSLQRKEREEKVRATKEKLDRDKEKKLQELIDSQKQAEELRLKQQILRKKKIDEMKNKDEERQRAAEERRKKREADEEERRQNFMKKRIERYAQADAEARVRKGKHESYGFGSSAPRFEEILLTSSPAARSSSQLNVSVHRTQDAIDGGSDNDSPRPGSASMEPTPLIFAARPLSKSTTNLSVPRRAPSTERPRKSTANYSNRSTADVRLSLQSRNRASFSPVALIGSTPPAGRSQERSKGAKGSALPPKISSAPAPKLNAELSPNLQSSVARLSAPRVASQTDEKRSKTSASSSGVPPSAIRKALSTTQLNRPEVKKAPLKTRSERSASTLSQRSMTSADVSRLGQTKDTPGRRSSDRPRSATRPTTSRVADRMTRSVTGPATSTDSDSGKKPSPSKGRSLSATRPHSTALDKKPAPPRAAAAKPKTADVMSRSMYAPSTSAKLAAKTEAKQIMKKAVSVGNVSKSALTVKKDTPTRPILKSKSAEPVKDSTSPRTQTTHTTATKPIVKTTVTKTKPSTDSKPSTTKPISKQPTKLATDSKPSTTKPISKQPTKLATDSKPSTTKPISKQPTKLATDSKPSSLKPSSSKTTPDTSRRSSGDSGKAPKQMTEEPPKGPEVVTEEQKEKTTPADTPTTETPATTESSAEQPEVQAPAAVTEVEKKPEEQAAVKPDAEKVEEKIEKAESVTMPAAAEASKPKSAKEAQMDEYKAKLAEKRREAREKAEREAEAERQRVEAERLAEEEREREEEERQLAFEAEQMKLAAEARQLEQERLEVAIAEAEQRRLEETERLEVERIQKEQAVESARQEAEVAKKQREEKIAREEQEKLERKKKLEMIMARVKTASPTPDKVMTESSPAVMTTSMTSSQSSTFKSPLLAGLMGNKENKTAEGGSEKKFASSLLNNIMAKVSADRSEDTSAASSTGNSGSTSPEHKVSPSTSTLNTSSIEPQTQPDSAIVNTEQKSSNSVEPSTLVHKNGHVENAPFYVDDEVTPHVENKSIVSSKTDLNGASNGLHTNGDLSAGAQAETNFEQVIALDDSAPAVMPPVSEPYQAFTDESSNHVEEVH